MFLATALPKTPFVAGSPKQVNTNLTRILFAEITEYYATNARNMS